MKTVLEELAEEGFKFTGQTWAELPIYKSSTEYVLYNKATKKVYLRYEIDKQYLKPEVTK